MRVSAHRASSHREESPAAAGWSDDAHSAPRPATLLLWVLALALSCGAGLYLNRIDDLLVGVATVAAFLCLLGIASSCPRFGKH